MNSVDQILPNNLEDTRLIQNNPCANAAFMARMSWRDLAHELAKQNDELQKQAVKLSVIAPVKFIRPDGTVLVNHCPDHLISETLDAVK